MTATACLNNSENSKAAGLTVTQGSGKFKMTCVDD